MPQSHILFYFLKKENLKKEEEEEEICWGGGHPVRPRGGSTIPRLAVWGWLNYSQAKWGGWPPPMRWFGHPSIFFFKKKK